MDRKGEILHNIVKSYAELETLRLRSKERYP